MFSQTVFDVLSFLKENNVNHYIHAGTALSLHGFGGELDDVDIRISPVDAWALDALEKKYSGKSISYTNRKFSNGVYVTRCLEIEKSVDVCGVMCPRVDFGLVTFPFDKKPIKFSIGDENKSFLQVASLESLLLYYLVLRRDIRDGKSDLTHVNDLLNSGKIDYAYFSELIKETGKESEINGLFEDYKQKVGLRV